MHEQPNRRTADLDDPEPGERRGASIVPYSDGPLIVRGDFELRAQDGSPIAAGRRTVALCRCGKSRTRPFCDGTHQLVGFRAAGASEREIR
jgi:CDGSH-type Zn-finger protein